MKRRAFFPVAAGTTAAALTGAGCRIEKIQPVPRPIENLRIADRTLEELREQYRYDLFDDFLPFMDKYVIDHEFGGFMCCVDRDGSRVSSEKHAVWEGQGMSVFSFLYNRVAKDDKYRDIANKSLTFLRKNRPVGENLWPDAFSRQGTPTAPPDARGCTDLVIAAGLLEYAQASGEKRWLDLAKETLFKIMRLYDHPAYYPAYGQEFLGPKAPLLPGARVQAVWTQIISLSSRLLTAQPDQDVKEILDRSLNAVMNFHFNPEFRLHNEILTHDLSRPSDEYGQLVHIGNSIEALRIVLYEAASTGNRELFETAADRFRHHVDAAWDPIFGGVYTALSNVERNEWNMTKTLRVQEEVLTGALFIIEHTGANWAKELFGRMYSYVRDRFTLRQYGYPLWMTVADRKTTFEPHANMVDIYYHPRHLMLNLLSLDRMLSRGGKVSNLFG